MFHCGVSALIRVLSQLMLSIICDQSPPGPGVNPVVVAFGVASAASIFQLDGMLKSALTCWLGVVTNFPSLSTKLKDFCAPGLATAG